MTIPPPGFILATALRKAAADGGFGLGPSQVEGWPQWLAFDSATVKGRLFLAGASDAGPYYLAHSRADLAAGLAVAAMSGPGAFRAQAPTLATLHEIISLLWTRAREKPAPDPLAEFMAATNGMPRGTEAERLVIQRVGQDIFRNRLMVQWEGRCPLTGITDPALLRASHIIPWSRCENDAERLDPENGLLLSALWDAAFDRGLLSFGDDGEPLFSPQMTRWARKFLVHRGPIRGLTDGQRRRLAVHRAEMIAADATI